MITSEDISKLNNIPGGQDLELPFASGDDNPESLWKNFINTRLQVDGDHIFLKTRGGSNSVDSFASQILTIYPFATTISATQKNYIAVHCDNGNVYIYDVDADTQSLLFTGIFSTTNQIEFTHDGLFLYIFDPDTETYKYYNLEASAGYDWLGSLGGSITSFSWITGKWTDDNMWGIREGGNIIMIHNFIEGYYEDPLTAENTFRTFQTKVNNVYTTHFYYQDPDGKDYRSNANGSLVGFAPATPDILEDYENYPALYTYDKDQQQPVDNNDYRDPVIYKGYLVVDLLDDGSYLTPGRPITVSSSFLDINTNRRLGVALSLSTPPAGVVKRYLFATRWQSSPVNVFQPSRPEYPNSAFFLVKPVDVNQSTVRDVASDSNLLEEINSFIPLTAGVLQMFGPDQIVPNSVSTARSTLLIGGYRIDRPTPQVYTDPANSGEKNIFWDQVAGGTNLTGNPELAFQFEYTDGKKSSIVETGEILTDAEDDTVIDPGGVATKAFGSWSAFVDPSGSGNITVKYPYNEYEEETVIVPYLDSDTVEDVLSDIADAINADGDIQITAEYFDVVNAIRFTEKRDGAEFNASLINISGDTFEFQFPVVIETITMSGGSDAITEEKRTGNRLQIHSLNALVNKVFILATETDDPYAGYRLLREVEVSEPDFHGKVIYLQNSDTDFDAVPEYITPPVSDQRESVDLPGYMVPSVPFQQPRINEQKKLEGSVRIGRLVPWRFADDQSELRFQIVAFTETNIQLGYLVFSGSGAFSLDASFEVILEGIRATSYEAIGNVSGRIFFPGDKYMYMWSGGSPTPLFDVNRYSVSANNNPVDVVLNQDHSEVWIFYPNQDAIAINLYDNAVRRMNFNNLGNIKAAGYYGGKLYTGAGADIVEVDVAGQDYDLTDTADNKVEGVAQTKHIGTHRQQSKIIEAIIGGQGGTVELDIDLQPERKEGDTSAWPLAFTSAQNYAAKTLYIHGASFNIQRRAVMPRLQITFESGFIEYVTLRHVVTDNKGIARKS